MLAEGCILILLCLDPRNTVFTMTLVHIRYKDHILFRNSDPSLYYPAIRECVGWVLCEDEKAIWIISDRSSQPLPNEKANPRQNGLVLLKGEIIEMRKLE
jgi:hypothetical protein